MLYLRRLVKRLCPLYVHLAPHRGNRIVQSEDHLGQELGEDLGQESVFERGQRATIATTPPLRQTGHPPSTDRRTPAMTPAFGEKGLR